MKKKIAVLLVMVFGLGLGAYILPTAIMNIQAQTFTGSVSALPQANATLAVLSRIDASTDPDTWSNGTSLDFVLQPMDTWYVYRSNTYYALDVGTNGAGPWTITHTATGSFAVNGTTGVGDNIIVTCVRQTGNTTATALSTIAGLDTEGQTSLYNIRNGNFPSTELNGGWLRIYYGIYGGAATTDAANYSADCFPITNNENLATTATGSLVISLTQN